MGFLSTGLKNECYGCTACEQICPKDAIVMQCDNEGFLYPFINKNLCVKCDLCKKVCSAEKNVQKVIPLKAISTIHKDENVLLNSSSGGAFKSLLEVVDENTIVYGACWESRSVAVFDKSTIETAFSKFRKSKYIQAELRDTYSSIKADLENEDSVLFVGTPCQVSGLKEYLGKEYDKLIMVDLICHGVPSSKILEKQFESWDSKKNKAISIEFRHKENKKGVWNSKYAKVCFESGITKIFEYDTSAFLRGYDNGLFFRPSCSTCQFATLKRLSDITIGDYWGSKEYDVHKGLSLVFANTKKGIDVISKLEKVSIVNDIDIEHAVAHNARLKKPDKGHNKREDFFNKIDSENFEKLVQSYIPRVPAWKKFAHKIKNKFRGLK